MYTHTYVYLASTMLSQITGSPQWWWSFGMRKKGGYRLLKYNLLHSCNICHRILFSIHISKIFDLICWILRIYHCMATQQRCTHNIYTYTNIPVTSSGASFALQLIVNCPHLSSSVPQTSSYDLQSHPYTSVFPTYVYKYTHHE